VKTKSRFFALPEVDIKGSLNAGKLADITVLNQSLISTKPSDWIDEKGRVSVDILYTIVGGKIVYSEQSQ